MTNIKNPYQAYLQQASRSESMKAAYWVYEAGNGPDLLKLLNQFSDKQLLIFQGFANEWGVDEEFTLRMLPQEDHARVKLEIDLDEAGFAAIREVIKAEVLRRGIPQ